MHDTGKVIPPESRERIFEPRRRGCGEEEARISNGLGLGLYICREIVRAGKKGFFAPFRIFFATFAI